MVPLARDDTKLRLCQRLGRLTNIILVMKAVKQCSRMSKGSRQLQYYIKQVGTIGRESKLPVEAIRQIYQGI
jgi:hypothetical protein